MSLSIFLSVPLSHTPTYLTLIQSKGLSHVFERSDVVDSRGDDYP